MSCAASVHVKEYHGGLAVGCELDSSSRSGDRCGKLTLDSEATCQYYVGISCQKKLNIHQDSLEEIVGIGPTSLCLPESECYTEGQEDIGDYVGE
jgi:hypothetical protein